MKPLLSSSANEKANLKSLLELCNDAHELNLLFRKSKAVYKVRKLEPGTVVCEDVEPSIVVQALEGPAGPADGRDSKIAYTLFAALVKQPDVEIDEEYILEKAHVICKA